LGNLLDLSVIEAPSQCSSEVPVVGFEPGHPLGLMRRAQTIVRGSDQVQEEPSVSLVGGIGIIGLRQPRRGVVIHGLQHREAWFAPGGLVLDQTLLEQ
jgi:hypothetical protein